MRKGFSLVELSIVLVILGLLTGGILTGQNLIRAAELRSLVSEFQSHHVATRTFQDKYFAIPGDMANATDFWGSAACPGTAGTGTETCNGNGDGRLNSPAGVSQYGETFTFWQHLANAGMIEGSYTGMASSGSVWDAETGENVPASKLSNGAWSTNFMLPQSGHAQYFNRNYGNIFFYGVPTATGPAENPILKPEEMWNLDTKIDDGMPATGKFVTRVRVNCTVQADGSAQTTAGGNAALLDSKYNLQNTSTVCSVIFMNGF